MVVSSRWFLLNRPELRKSIEDRLAGLGITDYEVHDDFAVPQGQSRDPFLGVFMKSPHLPGAPWEGRPSDHAVIFAVGCSGMMRNYGKPGDAYVGLRAWPPFGGSGERRSQKGTLDDGVAWTAQYRGSLNTSNPSFERDWEPAHMQWVAWKEVADSSETPAYTELLVSALESLVLQLNT
jgi:hypothetical protein